MAIETTLNMLIERKLGLWERGQPEKERIDNFGLASYQHFNDFITMRTTSTQQDMEHCSKLKSHFTGGPENIKTTVFHIVLSDPSAWMCDVVALEVFAQKEHLPAVARNDNREVSEVSKAQ